MTFWASRRVRTIAYAVAILIHGTIIAIGYFFLTSVLLSTIAPSVAGIIAIGITTFLVVGGAMIWYRVIVLGQMPWEPRYAMPGTVPIPPPPPAPPPGASEDEVIKYAQALRARYMMDEAVTHMRGYLGEHPDALRPRLLLASLLSSGMAKNPSEAKQIYEEILREHPDNIAALCGLAMLHTPSGVVPVSQAVQLLAKAAELSDDPELIWTYASVVMDYTGDWEGARAGFERVIAHPRSGPPSTLRRRAREMLKHIKQRRFPKVHSLWWPEL